MKLQAAIIGARHHPPEIPPMGGIPPIDQRMLGGADRQVKKNGETQQKIQAGVRAFRGIGVTSFFCRDADTPTRRYAETNIASEKERGMHGYPEAREQRRPGITLRGVRHKTKQDRARDTGGHRITSRPPGQRDDRRACCKQNSRHPGRSRDQNL